MKLTALQRPRTHEQNVKLDWKPRKKPVVLDRGRFFLLDFPFHRRGRGYDIQKCEQNSNFGPVRG